MSDLTNRIRRVTDDLHAVQDVLNAAAQHDASPAERDSVMEELLNMRVLDEFKAAVDNMRHLLWSYIEASNAKNAHGVSYTLQHLRMRRVTDMLRILQPNVEEAKIASSPEAKSFFEVINSIANSAVDRHQEDAAVGKSSAKASAKKKTAH